MAKKTIKVGLRSTGMEPAAGDVNISYKGSRIAGLSESSTAVLETENTIVQDDIEVEYIKPAGGAVEVAIDVYHASALDNPTYTKDKTITGYPGTIAVINGAASSMWLCDTTGANDNKAMWPFNNRNGKAAIPDIAAINEAGNGTNPYTYNGIAYYYEEH